MEQMPQNHSDEQEHGSSVLPQIIKQTLLIGALIGISFNREQHKDFENGIIKDKEVLYVVHTRASYFLIT